MQQNHQEDDRKERIREFSSACGNNLNAVKQMVEQHGQWLVTTAAPLCSAATANKLDILIYLLDNGAQINAIDAFGWTAFHYVAYDNSLDVLEYLWDNFPNERDRRTGSGVLWGRESLIHVAARGKSFRTLEYLINQEYFDIDIKDKSNNTPLHWAMKKDARNCSLLLIKSGADQDSTNNFNKKPIDMSINNNFREDILRDIEYIDTVFLDENEHSKCSIM